MSLERKNNLEGQKGGLLADPRSFMDSRRNFFSELRSVQILI
jgi:hypothetical protein